MILCVGAGARAATVYQPPDPEPTPEEVLLLELINRFRIDPVADAQRIRANPGVHAAKRTIDWTQFEAEIAATKAAQPLVMNLKLLLSARRHAYYLSVNNKRGHVEEDALSGFTGEKMPQRVVEAGYQWTSWYENVYVAPSAWDVHAGFVVDFSHKSADGMQEGRGHRVNMLRPELREIGTGTFPRENDTVYTEGFGNRKGVARFIGGVVIVDRDADGFYDVGEGVGGVTVTSSDGAQTKTWKSGGYTLELQTTDAVTLTFTKGRRKQVIEVPAGDTNVKVDWSM